MADILIIDDDKMLCDLLCRQFKRMGHDAVYAARVAPTAMIFIPCRDGIGHSELEYASPEIVAAGANVLLHAVLGYDGVLARGTER